MGPWAMEISPRGLVGGIVRWRRDGGAMAARCSASIGAETRPTIGHVVHASAAGGHGVPPSGPAAVPSLVY